MSLPDAVIFDLDGTLIDSIPDVLNAVNATLAHFDRAPLTLQSIRKMVGHGANAMLDMAFDAAGGGPVPDDALEIYLRAYSDNPTGATVVYDGARQALSALVERDVLLGICTNKPSGITRLVLDRLGLTPCFAAIVAADDVARRKPDACHVWTTLEAMGRPACRAVMIGDSATDVQAASAAGIPSVVVTFGYDGVAALRLGANASIDHFDDLLPALERLP